MWNDNEASTYQGLFARQPDNVRETIGGNVETHSNPLGPDTIVTKDLFGEAKSVETSWFNS
jgi:hypothetical protein